jgi:Reeler domain
MKLVVIFAFLLIAKSSAFPNGAPESACFTLSPNHGTVEQDTWSPVFIEIDSNVVIRGNSVQIKISSSREFKGFLIQPRTIVQPFQVFGNFEETSEVKTLNCLGRFSNTATHTSPTPRFNQTFTWNSGNDFLGAIRFQ